MMKKKLLELVKGKRVQLCTHWDADGVTSAAIVYHLIKKDAKSITTKTKGMQFIITPEDVNKDAEVIICTDIHPSPEILELPNKPKIIYIDHHPCENKDKFTLTIHDENSKSASLLIYNTLLKGTKDPYMIFLVLVGYFGDGGNREEIPEDLLKDAETLIPEMMEKRDSLFHDGFYYEIEKYVSALNTGKRMNWCGDVPLELLKSIDSYEPYVYGLHPIAVQLRQYRHKLKESYNAPVEVKTTGKIDYIIIEDTKNVQGVLAAKHINGKPIMVINLLEQDAIGSMRCPENLDFDVGKFLSDFSDKIEGYLGGGHKCAGGFTLNKKELEIFLELVKSSELNMLD